VESVVDKVTVVNTWVYWIPAIYVDPGVIAVAVSAPATQLEASLPVGPATRAARQGLPGALPSSPVRQRRFCI
jgi:hypothetical protein